MIILEHPAQPSTKLFSFLSPRGIRCSACHWRSLWEFHGPVTCALLLVAVICHSDPTALAFVWAHQMEVIKWILMGCNFDPKFKSQPICRVKPGSVSIPRQLGNYQRAL